MIIIRVVVRDEKVLENMVMNTSLKEYRALEKMLADQPLMQPTLKEMCNQHLITATIFSKQEPLPQRCISLSDSHSSSTGISNSVVRA